MFDIKEAKMVDIGNKHSKDKQYNKLYIFSHVHTDCSSDSGDEAKKPQKLNKKKKGMSVLKRRLLLKLLS